ncbi:hypothetical protein [Ilyobacter polytropus]|uniref:Uncharacterized protein n=1 Tax=Ilyobacter polytropus (strain ATCC 51220 / DSM 2926 / LMG 16218 / CuHBu1) TaxID=572544 RepID=E3H9N4_ILYPC|nr:hypothetical protein [Ilyobacter polytropus]ADO83423.1 hypothetical protein Ilyop_1650 [Ilyobacter polytropus DSM 2926]
MILSIGRERLYKRNYEREGMQEATGSSSGGCIHDSLSRVVAQMISKG